MKYLSLIFLTIWLSACGSAPSSTPLPTPVSIFLSYPAYLQPTADLVTRCAGMNASLTLFLDPIPADQSQLPGVLLQISLGESDIIGDTAYQVGSEEIKIITNDENPLTQLSTDQLVEIYVGQQTNWEFNDQPPIHFWAYPPDNNLRSILETVLPGNPRLSSQARIAPNPSAVIQAVASDPAAIGFVPSSWLDSLTEDHMPSLRILNTETTLSSKLTQPVLISFVNPISPSIQSLLICVQNSND